MKNFSIQAATLIILILIAGPAQSQPQTTVLVNAHFDLARQAPISSIVYQKPLSEKFFVNGFLEAWWNTDVGFPAETVTLFSKTWLSYSVTPRLAASVEVELLYNRPGVAIKFPHEMLFQPETAYVIPKIGFTYRVK